MVSPVSAGFPSRWERKASVHSIGHGMRVRGCSTVTCCRWTSHGMPKAWVPTSSAHTTWQRCGMPCNGLRPAARLRSSTSSRCPNEKWPDTGMRGGRYPSLRYRKRPPCGRHMRKPSDKKPSNVITYNPINPFAYVGHTEFCCLYAFCRLLCVVAYAESRPPYPGRLFPGWAQLDGAGYRRFIDHDEYFDRTPGRHERLSL